MIRPLCTNGLLLLTGQGWECWSFRRIAASPWNGNDRILCPGMSRRWISCHPQRAIIQKLRGADFS